MKSLRKFLINLLILVWIASVLIGIVILRNFKAEYFSVITAFLSINFIYLLIKLVSSLTYQDKVIKSKTKYTISAILPCYNEDKDAVLKAIDSLFQQSYPIQEILFIDDGSSNQEAFLAVKELSMQSHLNNRLKAIRFEENVGKKKVQQHGFEICQGEIFMLFDSDSEISSTVVEEMVGNFDSEKVGAVVGKIEPRNASKNFITRLQDILYTNAFQLGRRAQAHFGCVSVCSGALSMYRAGLVKANLDLFSKERFFGIKCISGDDRLLTMITLKEGYKTVYQESAVCRTDVPESLSKYFKQQVRWAKSGYILTLYSFKYLYKRPIAIIFQVLESYLWLFNLILFIISVFMGFRFSLTTIIAAIFYSILVYYISCIYYSKKQPLIYMYGFIYNFFYGFILIAIRIYALLTITKSKWSTR